MIPSDDLHLYELFVRYWDNSLTPAEAEELEGRLAADPVVRNSFQLFTMQAVAAAELPPSMRPEIERERIGEFASTSENTPRSQPFVPESPTPAARARGFSRRRVLQLTGGALAAGVAGIGLGRWFLGDSRNGVRVVSVQGVVTVRTPDGRVSRGRSDGPIPDRAMISTTGILSAAVLEYRDGTTVSLIGDSAVSVHANGQELWLHRGTATADVRTRKAGSEDLSLMTPLVTLPALNGVLLTLGLGTQGAEVEVQEGTVAAADPTGTPMAVVREGEMLIVRPNGDHSRQATPGTADEFVLDFSQSLPDGWAVGNRVETADGVVLRPELWPDPYYGGTAMHQIRSDHRWTRGFFRVVEESVVHVRYRAERELADGQMCFCARTPKTHCSDTGMLHYNDGFKATPPGEWEWLHVRIADMLRNNQAPRFRTPMVMFLLIFNTYTEDIGLEIAEFRVTPPGKKFEQ